MEARSAGNDLTTLWMERYPEIAFLASYEHSTPFEVCENADGTLNAHRNGFFLHAADIDQEVTAWQQKLDLQEIDILYLFGIGLGHYYPPLKSWLKEKSERILIILEDDLAVFATLSALDISYDLLTDPQVQIQLIADTKGLPETLTTFTQSYPSVRIEVTALQSYAEHRAPLCQKIRTTLLRASAIADALMTDALYSHYLLENVLRNFHRWPHSFLTNGLKQKFRNIPAIICGAGPSLGPTIPLLKELEDRALIIAGGSTITALSNQGVIPHLGMAFDPNAEEYARLRVTSAFEMPLIYGTRVQPDLFGTSNGPFGYLHSGTGGPCETYFEHELGIAGDPVGPELGQEALSITTLAIALAVELGCNPIILNGVDLAYTGMQRYAEGVMPTSEVFADEIHKEKRSGERPLRRKSIQGKMVYTLVKWVMESSSISRYAKAHKEVQFLNATAGGLGFKGIPNISLSEVVQNHCQTTYDLRSWVHAEIQQLTFPPITAEKLQGLFTEMGESLKRMRELSIEMQGELTALKHADEILERPFPTGKMTILSIDFEEEKAFECFFPHVGPALDRLLNRSHPIPVHLEPQETRLRQIDRLATKWVHLQKMIEKEIALIFSNNG